MSKTEMTEYERAIAEVYDAKHDFLIAKNQFENALPEFFDIANSQYTITSQRLDLAVKRVRQLYAYNS